MPRVKRILVKCKYDGWGHVFVTGNTEQLGQWDLSKAVPMAKTYSRAGVFYSLKIESRNNENVEYKFTLMSWESGQNRSAAEITDEIVEPFAQQYTGF